MLNCLIKITVWFLFTNWTFTNTKLVSGMDQRNRCAKIRSRDWSGCVICLECNTDELFVNGKYYDNNPWHAGASQLINLIYYLWLILMNYLLKQHLGIQSICCTWLLMAVRWQQGQWCEQNLLSALEFYKEKNDKLR